VWGKNFLIVLHIGREQFPVQKHKSKNSYEYFVTSFKADHYMLPHLNIFSTSNQSDLQIIQNISLGGISRRRAEEQLFSACSYYIGEGMKKYSLREDEAFDAYSDAILSTIQSVVNGTFEQRSSLKTYVYKVFLNKCVDVIRKNTTNKSSVNKTLELPEMLANMADNAKSVIQQLVDRFDLQEMKRILSELGETCNSLLSLFAEGYTDKEIAVSMNYKSQDVVKTSRLRCLQKLRQEYSIKQPK
jgi:RNA polymerase sigma factor (sigma-70 family)